MSQNNEKDEPSVDEILSSIKDVIASDKNLSINKTRKYAKRQSTWGRGNMMDWNKIKSENLNKFLKKI